MHAAFDHPKIGFCTAAAAASRLPGVPLRDQVDLDSMDWLNFLVGLHGRLGVDIPEADYRKLVTLDDLLAYLAARLPASSGGAK